jgi:hypothetical protein
MPYKAGFKEKHRLLLFSIHWTRYSIITVGEIPSLNCQKKGNGYEKI